MEVGLGLGHIVLDWDPAPFPQKGTEPPIIGPFLLWPNGWMDEDATWYRSRPRPGLLCIRRVLRYPRKGHSAPLFGLCLLWPRSPISAAAELLFDFQSSFFCSERRLYDVMVFADH